MNIRSFEMRKRFWGGRNVLTLSTQNDICDYLALGFFCLMRRAENPDARIVKVKYRSFEGENSRQMIGDWAVPMTALHQLDLHELYNLFWGLRSEFEKMPYTPQRTIDLWTMPGYLTAYAHGKYNHPWLNRIWPPTFNIEDTIGAQQLAYNIMQAFTV